MLCYVITQDVVRSPGPQGGINNNNYHLLLT